MKQRYILTVLLILALLYYAVPRLPIDVGGDATLFSLLWLSFCIVAFGGNVKALLYRRYSFEATKQENKSEPTNRNEYKRSTGC